MSGRWNPEQAQAIERDGRVFVSAGAGTGKTAVLVERVLRRLDAGTALDRILVITFTDRAASELKQRVRDALVTRGDLERARTVDSAWISTIHRFCMRLLRAHSIEAGLDPRFTVSDEVQARIVQSEAFDLALERFLAEGGERRLDLLAAYSRRRLRELLTEAFERLRSAGRPVRLVAHAAPDLEPAMAAARAAAVQHSDREEAAALTALLESRPAAAELCDLSRQRIRNTEQFQDYNAARTALEDAARDSVAAADLVLLDALLEEFATAYQELKDRRSLVDFTDLELRARDLLAGWPELAATYRERFAEVMVDEFQDTNRLQCELIDQVAGERVFLVGDEFQSIYRFRHADVDVYRERRAAAGDGLVELVRNYRSRPHVLDMVNELHTRTFGERYTPLIAESAAAGPAPAGGRVELLVTDKAAFRQAGLRWREAEAEALAGRVAELVEQDGFLPGQVVVLLEAGTDAAIFEQALRRRHLRTVRTTGRGYYAQQQVADLLGYLRLLRNRYDDVALLSVLASPLVGMSNDGMLALRRAAPRRPIFTVFERDELPERLAADDRRLAAAFRQRYTRLSARAGELGLERLLDLIVGEHDYDLACLAQADGDRRFANVLKLARLAGDYEGLRGPDLEGFIEFCDEQAAVATREGEAATAEEDQDAVVLMTVHAAKGLEFDVVVLADCGRERGARNTADVLVDSLGRVALRAPDPTSGGMRPALGFTDVAQAERAAEAEEGRRLQYVALTRARQHLIVSGALDPAEDTTIAHICTTLGVDLSSGGDVDSGQAKLRVQVQRPVTGDRARRAPAADANGAEIGDQLALFADTVRPPAVLEPLEPAPSPAPVAVRRLSYSALALHRRCGYRYFAQRVLGLPERAVAREDGIGLDPLEMGDAVHLELERADGRWRAVYEHATDEDTSQVAAFVENWRSSSLASRVAAMSGLRYEVPFSFEVEGVLFRGRLDVCGEPEPGRLLIVDYKTNRLGERTAEEVVEGSYRTQITTYALAALRSGCREVEIVYAFLEQPDAIVVRRFGQDDADGLEAELREQIADIRSGRFPARPGPHCQDCPALDLLCAGPALEWEEA
ncbi:MAG: UvrD-helicase domain-containing protein [Gaiellales bacterium]